mgnify:CR=1 FL=1
MNLTAPPTQRFGAPFTPLAIEETALSRDWTPRAFLFWDEGPAAKPYRTEGDVAVVEIIGALDTRGGYWWDGYDKVLERCSAALADPKVKALVLAIDSPGGMAAGNLDCASELRAAIRASGKPCVAHAGTMAASAAYAIACAADAIHLTADGAVGSIGTIATVYDRTKANAAEGYDVRVVRSGALKADPHPDVPLTDASVSRVRARINELAGMFAAHVTDCRPQLADPLSLQGACFYGADAVTRGLADAVGTLGAAITHAAAMAATATKRKTAMNAEERLVAMRAAANVTSDDELVAHHATTRATAARVPDLEKQLAEARAEIAARDTATKAAAREGILTKHRQRGALSPAMEADTAFMGDLAPLAAESLDRVLSRLPSAPAAVTPRSVGAVDPTGVDAASVELTADEKAFAAKHGVSEEALLKTKRADAARTAASLSL